MPAYCIILRHRLECLRTIVVQCRSPSPGLMTLKEVFINPYGRLRSGWRVLIFVFVYICLLFVLSAASRVAYALALMLAPGRVAGVFASLAGYVENIVFRFILLVAALAAGYICTRWLECLPWRALCLSLHVGWLRDLLVGSLIGVASLSLATALATAGGGVSFTISARGALLQVGQTLIFSAILFILAGLAGCIPNISSLCSGTSEKPERGGGLHLHQYRARRCLAGNRLSPHAELMVPPGRSLGVELGPGLPFRSSRKRYYRSCTPSVTAWHRAGAGLVDRRCLRHRRRTRLHDYADSFNDLYLAHAVRSHYAGNGDADRARESSPDIRQL